jgi:hypothetical protein
VTVRDLLLVAVIACAIWVDRHSRRLDRQSHARLVVAEAVYAEAEMMMQDAQALVAEFTTETKETR